MRSNHTVTISLQSIGYLILLPLFLFLIWTIRDIIFSLLIGFILMSALKPAVKKCMRLGMGKPASAAIVFLIFVCIVILLIALIIPPIVTEFTALLSTLPHTLKMISPMLSTSVSQDVTSFVPGFTYNVVATLSNLFANILFIITTLFFGLYFLLDDTILSKFIHRYLDEKRAETICKVLSTAEARMSSWFWGEVALMTIVGLFIFVGLSLIGMKYALPLAVLAGLLEVVPNIGPTFSAIPAILIGFGISYFTGFSVLALYILVQQFENNIIVPVIMNKAVGINPITTLIALMIGGRIGGVTGLLLAIPIFLFAETVVAELLHSQLQKK